MHITKWLFTDQVEALRIVKPVVGAFYIALAEEAENTVVLPRLYRDSLYQCRHSVNYESLEITLLRDNVDTHHYLLHLLITLFKAHGEGVAASILTSRQSKLLAAVKRLGYMDLLWFYATNLMNPERRPVVLRGMDEKTTDLLLAYLYTQRESTINIPTLFRVYELRTTSLFRSLMVLLLQQKRYEKAREACNFMQKTLHVVDPLFYLSGETKTIYLGITSSS